MITQTKLNEYYVGPKALFDQNFIPPNILYREKETTSLFSLLKDSFSDGFSLNVLYQGIQGIGKKVIINKVIKDLYEYDYESSQIHKITINSSEKSFEEIMISILSEISSFQNINFDYKTILKSNISDLWNLFKLLCKKFQGDLIFVFYNIEDIKPELFRKFLQYGKEININFISTINKVNKPTTLDLLAEFDLKKKLTYFSYNELFEILDQRAKLTFSHQIDKDLIEFITDLIFEQYVPVPGKGIEVLKGLYPVLNLPTKLDNKEIINIVQNQFDTSHLVDEFNVLSYFSETDLLNIIFLDNLSNFFLRSKNYYISSTDLIDIYEVSCESVGYEKNAEEFNGIITSLINIGILSKSQKTLSKLSQISSKYTLDMNHFFITINPSLLKAITDSIFN